MLITCPECHQQVSDKALACPHCGYPISPKAAKISSARPKRMRLPNGFGQITEIRNQNLRNPFRVMVHVGYAEDGKRIAKPLRPKSYFATYNEAYQALIEYHRDPFDLTHITTMQELYDEWVKYKSKKVGASLMRHYHSVWEYSSAIYDIPVRDLRVRHMKKCLENGTALRKGKVVNPTPIVQKKMKSLYCSLLDYAIENELITDNIARNILLEEAITVQKEHIPYTEDEIQLLWSHLDSIPVADMLLIQCYTGWRPKELIDLKISDTDMVARTFRGGSKTKSGKNRIVPIHPRIFPLVEARYQFAQENGLEYLFNLRSSRGLRHYNYDDFQYGIKDAIKYHGLGANHRGHDGRVHFITEAKRANVDEYALKKIVGHSISDITESVYTKRDPDWLRTEIEKLK